MKEHHFALTERLQTEAMQVLFEPATNQSLPEQGFLGLITPGTGVNRRTLFLRQIIPAQDGELQWRRGLGFSPKYFSRALDRVAREPKGTGLIVVHCHPGEGGDPNIPPEPSWPDLESERIHLHLLARALRPGAPVAAGIVGGNGSWRVREYEWPRPTTPAQARSKAYSPRGGKHHDVQAVRLIGEKSLVIRRPNHRDPKDLTPVDSTIRLWGEEGQASLATLRIGIAGGGGVGSILVDFTARLGVGGQVIVDYDLLEKDNRNRAVGSKPLDIGKPKVTYLRRVAQEAATADDFTCDATRASLFEDDGLRPLLDCDVILGAADSALARQVLDHVSYAYLIPVIDGGTRLLVDAKGLVIGKSQTVQAGPGRRCLQCSGVYSLDEVTLELDPEHLRGPGRYLHMLDQAAPVTKDPPRAPSIINANGMVASLMIQRLLRYVLGMPPYHGDGVHRYYFDSGELRWAGPSTCEADCSKADWQATGDTHLIPQGLDLRWQRMKTDEAKKKPRSKK